ncbi:MAG: hypothetical protein ACREFB_13390, partial [Stellaceae bacterium]
MPPNAMDQKNLFLAILISVVILVGSEYLFGAFGLKPPPPTPKPAQTTHAAKPAPVGETPGTPAAARTLRSRAE